MKSKNTSKYLLMLFRGVLQSWGSGSRFNEKLTLEHPTKSGVIGLIGASIGIERNDDKTISLLNNLKIDIVSIHKDGTIVKDLQMIGMGYSQDAYIPRKKDGSSPALSKGQVNATALTNRYYLCDYIFFVIIHGESELIEKIGNGLQNPVYPVYFGRRCNVPSDIIFRGIFENKNNISERIIDYLTKNNISLGFSTVIEDVENNDSSLISYSINDVPINFKFREHKTRIVSVVTPKEYFKDELWSL